MAKRVVSEGMAWCGRCTQELPQENFDRNTRRGFEAWCRKCRKAYYQEHKKHRDRVYPPDGHTYCGRCKTIKPNDQFHPNQLTLRQGRKCKRSAYCKVCVLAINKSDEPPKKKSKFGAAHQNFRNKILDPISTDPLKLAYAAGVFDAEGTATLRGERTAQPEFWVANNNAVVLEAVRAVIGGTIKYRDIPVENNGYVMNQGALRIGGLLNISEVSKALLPYLTLKKERCQILIEASVISPEERRRKLRPLIRQMNKKGVKENPSIPEDKKCGAEEVRRLRDTDIAYLAGMVDGDGWLGYRCGLPVIHVGVSKFAIVHHLHNVFGGAIRLKKVEPWEKSASKVCWRPIWDREAWSFVLEKLKSYLTLKKKHAELALMAMNSANEEARLEVELRALTHEAHMEKFERVENQVEGFAPPPFDPRQKQRKWANHRLGKYRGEKDHQLEYDYSEECAAADQLIKPKEVA